MKLPSIQLMDRSSQVVSSIGTAINFVCLRQPKNSIGRHVANTARVLYLANVVVGLSTTILALSINFLQGKKSEFKILPMGVTFSMIPGGGFFLGFFFIKGRLFDKKQ